MSAAFAAIAVTCARRSFPLFLIALTVSITLSMQRSFAEYALGECTGQFLPLKNAQCSDFYWCGPEAACASAPSAPSCVANGQTNRYKKTVAKSQVGLCHQDYELSTSCEYCPATFTLICLQYRLYATKQGTTCTDQCPNQYYFEGAASDRCNP